MALSPELAELQQRLEQDLAEVLAEVAGLSAAQADWRPGPDRWSIGENLDHMTLGNRYFHGHISALVDRGRAEGLRAGPDTRRSWKRSRSLADPTVFPVKAPENWAPRRGLPPAELTAGYEQTFRALLEVLPAADELDMGALESQHFLGFSRNLYQWLDLAGAHAQRHLVQIRAIKAAPGFPTA